MNKDILIGNNELIPYMGGSIMKFLSNNKNSSLLNIISNLNPFKIVSDIENERTGVNKLGIIEAIITMIIYMLLTQLPIGIALYCNNIITPILVIIAFFIVTIVFYYYNIKNSNQENNFVKTAKKFTLKNIVFLLVIVCGYFLIQCSIFPFAKILPGYETYQDSLKRIATNFVFMITYGCVLGPVMEEFVFRGIILRGLLKSYSNKTAILLSALIFAIFHLNLIQGMVAFLLGLLLGYVYIKTHSIYLCMLTHIINNIFFFSLSLLYPQWVEIFSCNILRSILITIAGLLIIIFGFKKLIGNINNSNIQKTLNIPIY